MTAKTVGGAQRAGLLEPGLFRSPRSPRRPMTRSSGTSRAGWRAPTAVPISSLAGAGLVIGTHALDVTAGAGSSLVVSANDVQRGALTGAIVAAQDSNATTFGTIAANTILVNA